MKEKLKNIYKKENKKIIIILLALFVTISFSLSLDMVTNDDIKDITENTGYVTKILMKLNYSIDKNIFQSLILFIGLYLLFDYTLLKAQQNKKIWKIILALLFSFFMIFGYSYKETNSWDLIFGNTFQLFKAIVKGIGYYILFRALINYLFDYLFCNVKVQETTNKVYNFIFVKHSFIVPLVIIIICWIPYIVAYYPGILCQDSTEQIKQFFGYEVTEGSSTNSVNLIDENVKIKGHHPVVHTVLLGLCLKLGKIIGSDNIGIFIYSIMQVLLLSSTFAYIINFIKKLRIPNWIRTIALLMYALIPVFPVYSMYVTKDVMFFCFFVFYAIEIYKLVTNINNNKIKKSGLIKIILISLLVAIFRNNGIYTIILSLPLIAIIDKINRKRILFTTLLILVIYEGYNVGLEKIFKIPPASIREALSIPFQQTARYVRDNEEEITDEEKEAINKVLDYETIGEKYNENSADAVKKTYNKDATSKELLDYFKVWFSQFLKHPTTYIQATLNNTYGYFYPDANPRLYTIDFMVDNYNAINKIEGFKYGYIENLRNMRESIQTATNISSKLPGIAHIMNIALNVWLLIIYFGYYLYTKRYRYLISLMPYLSIVLVCIASPVNTYFRYSITFVFTIPLILATFLDSLYITNNNIDRRENNE